MPPLDQQPGGVHRGRPLPPVDDAGPPPRPHPQPHLCLERDRPADPPHDQPGQQAAERHRAGGRDARSASPADRRGHGDGRGRGRGADDPDDQPDELPGQPQRQHQPHRDPDDVRPDQRGRLVPTDRQAHHDRPLSPGRPAAAPAQPLPDRCDPLRLTPTGPNLSGSDRHQHAHADRDRHDQRADQVGQLPGAQDVPHVHQAARPGSRPTPPPSVHGSPSTSRAARASTRRSSPVRVAA